MKFHTNYYNYFDKTIKVGLKLWNFPTNVFISDLYLAFLSRFLLYQHVSFVSHSSLTSRLFFNSLTSHLYSPLLIQLSFT